ncbi:MAG TPA: right-handed parallel beta-helix repeat-containing protein [Longimicrobium sp.]|nr:right-handed parallel beta-helix repeat-containing protein [Longimicrobium sp.]
MTFVIREAGGVRFTEKLVLGAGLSVGPTAEGAPELVSGRAGEIQLAPTGLDDTKQIQDALARGVDVRLGAGTFTVSATITVGSGGAAQRLIGAGPGATRLLMNATAPGVVVRLAASRCGVESLWIDNPGNIIGVLAAITPGGSAKITGIVLRDLRMTDADLPVQLENPVTCAIENLHATGVSNYGIYVNATATECTGVTVRNVTFEGLAGVGLVGVYLGGVSATACEGVVARQFTQHGVWVNGGSGHHLAGIRAVECGAGVTVQNASAATLEGADVLGVPGSALITQTRGIQVTGAKDVAVHGCRVTKMPEPVRIASSENVVVGAVRSDTSGTTIANPHLAVTASPGVFVTSFRIVNPAVPPAFEVDVAGAGSRVLFGPHNFAAGRINSGGFFAAL